MVVLLRVPEAQSSVDSPKGRIAVGGLIVGDLVIILVLVLLPAIAGHLGGVPVGFDTSFTQALPQPSYSSCELEDTPTGDSIFDSSG